MIKDMLGRDAVVSVETAREIFDKNFNLPKIATEDISIKNKKGQVFNRYIYA